MSRYALDRLGRIARAQNGPDYPRQPMKRVLMQWIAVYGGFRKPGTTENSAQLRKFFRERQQLQDARLERYLEDENGD